MTSRERLLMAFDMMKGASTLEENPHHLHRSLAALSGMFGPIGTTLYERGAGIEPSDRWGIVGRSALGGGIGAGVGWIAGIPVSLATGIPILPSKLLAGVGGLGGSMAGAWRGASQYNQMQQRHRPKPKKEKKTDEH